MKIVSVWIGGIVLSWLLVFGVVKAFSQEQPINVPLLKAERETLLLMCSHAWYASRVQWDGACEVLRRKFSDLEAAQKTDIPLPPPKPK